MKRRWLLESAGVMLIFLLPYFWDLLIPGSLALFHHSLSIRPLVGGILLDMLAFVGIGVLALALLSRLPPFLHLIAAAALSGKLLAQIFFLGISALEIWLASQYDLHLALQPHPILVSVLTWVHRHPHLIGIALPAFLVALAVVRPSVATRVSQGLRLGFAACSFSLLWIIPQLCYYGLVLHDEPSFDSASLHAPPKQSARVVWILLDELSYNLVFDHPPDGQQFPHLQALRSRSTSLADVQSFGSYTDRIIPSLLSGREIMKIRGSADGGLLYFDPALKHWAHFDPKSTLIALAQSNGWNPGVAGTSIPYCRMFKGDLTACSWVPSSLPIEAWIPKDSDSVLSSALAIPRALFSSFIPTSEGLKARLLDEDILAYKSVMDKSEGLIRDGTIRFLFLHLPVPHPPGIYDRHTHQLVRGGNYLDNLTLADDTTGTLLDEIDKTPWADQTTVIVSSDHSWRVPIWRSDRDWTAEEEAVSQGQFDKRPVFIVHFPSQRAGNDILDAMPELAEHEIIAAILEGRIKTPEDLNAAVDSFSQTSITGPTTEKH